MGPVDPTRPNPPPWGPAPPVKAVYGFLAVPPPPPVYAPNALTVPNNWYYQVEYTIIMHMNGPTGTMTAERIDLVNGIRLYRTRLQNLWRFDHDSQGSYIGRPPLPQFRWQYTDLSKVFAAKNRWTPLT
jgi:hypothetical protein